MAEAATPAAGHHPALRLQSRPQRASWLPSLVAPSEAPAGPRRKHLHTRGAEVLLVGSIVEVKEHIYKHS